MLAGTRASPGNEWLECLYPTMGSIKQNYRTRILSSLSEAGPIAWDALVNAQAIFSAPKHHDPQATKRHISTAVIGTRGGVGASTLATSLAWLFSADDKMPTALLDLDVHFGTGALALDLEPGRGLTDAIENPGRIDGLFIERAMIRANDHLAILSAEAPMNSPLTAARALLPGQSGRPTRPSRSHPMSTIPAFARSTGTNWSMSTANRPPRWLKAGRTSS